MIAVKACHLGSVGRDRDKLQRASGAVAAQKQYGKAVSAHARTAQIGILIAIASRKRSVRGKERQPLVRQAGKRPRHAVEREEERTCQRIDRIRLFAAERVDVHRVGKRAVRLPERHRCHALAVAHDDRIDHITL